MTDLTANCQVKGKQDDLLEVFPFTAQLLNQAAVSSRICDPF
jgi:hypothetical protein